MNEEGISPSVLNKRWLHSHEEDSENEMVFRPSTYPFPPRAAELAFNFDRTEARRCLASLRRMLLRSNKVRGR